MEEGAGTDETEHGQRFGEAWLSGEVRGALTTAGHQLRRRQGHISLQV